VFLDTGTGMQAADLAALPQAGGPVIVTGDAAAAVAGALAARGADAVAAASRVPTPQGVAEAARARLAGALPPLVAQPLYVDPPEAKLPAGGLRPPPLAASVPVPAAAAHAPVMAALHAAAFPPAERWGAETMLRLLAMPGAFGLLDADGAGFLLARIAADEAEILTLAVDPPARRRGIGRGLIAAGAALAGARGARTLFLEVAAANKAALALYQGAGFERRGLRRGYYPDGSDALLLALSLSPGAAAGG